jgi:hypothetical protein
VSKWPELIVVELLLGCAAGLLLSKGEGRHVRPLRLLLAFTTAIVITLTLMVGWRLDVLPFDLPVANWYALMILMGIYEASGFLASAMIIPWAPLRTRTKVELAVLSGAVVVGRLTYGGGDLMMMPAFSEHVGYFCYGAVVAATTAAVGYIARRLVFRTS